MGGRNHDKALGEKALALGLELDDEPEELCLQEFVALFYRIARLLEPLFEERESSLNL
jgi:hypothetical protein